MKTYKEAIVIGDGLAGLLAARALNNFFWRVYVIGQPRPVNNGPPIILHGPEQAEMEALFPGLLAELVTAGAARFNLGLHMAWFVYGRWRPRYRSALESVACSPALLAERIRRHLAGYPAIHFLPEEEIVGLDGDTRLTRITGVRLHESAALAADLVVDASGQVDRARGWLRQLAKRPATAHTPPLIEAGRLYQRPDHLQGSWGALVVQPAADQSRRGAVILPLEGGRLHLSLLGKVGDTPALSEAGFLAFARSLPTPRVGEIAALAVPLSPIHLLTGNSCSPCTAPVTGTERFILLPEPERATNPVLRQAIYYELQYQAALSETLALSLSDGLDGLPGHWSRQVAERLRPACMLARAEAQRWAGFVEMGGAAMSHYMGKVVAASLHSAQVLEALYAVQQMLEPPAILFRPDIVLQVVL
jgi:hypothetical protein